MTNDIIMPDGNDNNGNNNDPKDDIIIIDDTSNDNGNNNNDNNNNDAPPTEVEVDGVTYKFDDKGNAVNEKGEIVYTKDKIEELKNGNDTEAGIDDIIKYTNIIITDDTNKPVTYENSVEGITTYVNDVYTKGKVEGQQEYHNNLISTYPILEDVIQHLILNQGSLKDFGKEISYKSVEFKEEESFLIDTIKQARIIKGDTPEEADRFVKMSKDDNTLSRDGKIAFDFIQNKEKAERDARQKLIDDAEANNAKAIKEYWDSVNNIITKEKTIKLNDTEYKLPEVFRIKDKDGKIVTKTSSDFYDYLYKVEQFNVNGQIVRATRHQIDKHIEDSKRTVHHDIYDALLRFTKKDISQLVEQRANDKTVNNMKRKLSLTTNRSNKTNDNIIII